MQSCRSARYHLLVAVFLLSSLLVGCQGPAPVARRAAATHVAPAAVIVTRAPTRTQAVLPSTNTPTPPGLAVEPTRTSSPTPTATANLPATMSAKATNDKATKCLKDADAWEIKVTPYYLPGWCQINTIGGNYYEYKLIYPSQWTVVTFGDVFPSMAFRTGQQSVELRLYQVYKYGARVYKGTLEDAAYKASFCDTDDKCNLVVGTQEKITNKESRIAGGREVYAVDSQDGKYNVRRYFFFVPFKYATPPSNRLFFFKLYTPDPVTSANYRDMEQQIEDMITSLKHEF
jgi:hypothetical protein